MRDFSGEVSHKSHFLGDVVLCNRTRVERTERGP